MQWEYVRCDKRRFALCQGMFVIFDSSNQLFDSLIRTKKSQLTTKSLTVRRNLPVNNPLKYIVRRAIRSKSSTNADERYPTFGMDIPNSCKDLSKLHSLLESMGM